MRRITALGLWQLAATFCLPDNSDRARGEHSMSATDQLRRAGGIRRAMMWATIAALLIAPLLAMKLTPTVRWDESDFVAAAVVLIGVGIVVEAAVRMVNNSLARVAIIVAAFALGAMIWAHGAVGVF
jgi:hypothetical protein